MRSDEAPASLQPRPHEVTDLLNRWSGGEPNALHDLAPIVYDELRRVARALMRGERPDSLLEATGLVHEAFIRVTQNPLPRWGSRGEFFAWATKVMRHILVDHARSRLALKRGGGAAHVDIDEHEGALPWTTPGLPDSKWEDVQLLDEALSRLERLDEQQARIVELRFFGDLRVDETAEVLGISPATVKRDWATARAWLLREMRRAGS